MISVRRIAYARLMGMWVVTVVRRWFVRGLLILRASCSLPQGAPLTYGLYLSTSPALPTG